MKAALIALAASLLLLLPGFPGAAAHPASSGLDAICVESTECTAPDVLAGPYPDQGPCGLVTAPVCWTGRFACELALQAVLNQIGWKCYTQPKNVGF